MMKAYVIKDSFGKYMSRTCDIFDPFSPFSTKIYSTLKGAMAKANTLEWQVCVQEINLELGNIYQVNHEE